MKLVFFDFPMGGSGEWVEPIPALDCYAYWSYKMTDQTLRHYIHGDEKEGEHIYYCSACDHFVSIDHFYRECHVVNDYDLYLRSLKRWKMKKKNGTKMFRPETSRNYFA